jgi:hypothetical protein
MKYGEMAFLIHKFVLNAAVLEDSEGTREFLVFWEGLPFAFPLTTVCFRLPNLVRRGCQVGKLP